jgi:lactate permease
LSPTCTGPWLVDIIASMVSILAMVVLLRFWQPKETYRFDDDPPVEEEAAARRRPGRAGGELSPGPGAAARSELPASDRRRRSWPGCPGSCWPWLHLEVIRTPPVVPKDTAEKAVYDFFPLSATGTALLLTGIISGLALRLRPGEIGRVFLGTLNRVKFSLLTIAAMLAIGYVTRYGGLDASMGLAFAKTGKLFAFFSPLLGWLGVALTGSDTSSNALFGSLQKITATAIGISPVLAAASNSSGGVMGKMIDAQSIVVGGVATGQEGEEGNILRYVFFHSIALAILVGLLVLAQAYVFPGVVP